MKEWLLESPTRRNIPWPEIPIILGWNCGERAIKSAMLALGYKRRVKRRRPFLTFTAKVKRLRYTTNVRAWRFHEWQTVLFTDETWVRGGSHGQRFVTVADGEELDYISTTEKKTGWMFWGSILGTRKGPCMVWEKAWGSITADSYQEHIVPLVHEFMNQHPGCIFMQDNAPAHRARTTIADLTARGIRIMGWPPYSPDLNPIEHVWQWMKDWIARFYPEKMAMDQLHEALYAAWEAVPDAFIESLIRSMQDRVEFVYQRHGSNSKY